MSLQSRKVIARRNSGTCSIELQSTIMMARGRGKTRCVVETEAVRYSVHVFVTFNIISSYLILLSLVEFVKNLLFYLTRRSLFLVLATSCDLECMQIECSVLRRFVVLQAFSLFPSLPATTLFRRTKQSMYLNN